MDRELGLFLCRVGPWHYPFRDAFYEALDDPSPGVELNGAVDCHWGSVIQARRTAKGVVRQIVAWPGVWWDSAE